jgi:hypothetical protein
VPGKGNPQITMAHQHSLPAIHNNHAPEKNIGIAGLKSKSGNPELQIRIKPAFPKLSSSKNKSELLIKREYLRDPS